jgi:hypothetical protein
MMTEKIWYAFGLSVVGLLLLTALSAMLSTALDRKGNM